MNTIISDRKQAAILAGLRLLQAWREDKIMTRDANIDSSIDDVESDGGTHEPLSADEIDILCEELNVSGPIHFGGDE